MGKSLKDVISLKESKFFMSGLRQFFEQSEMDEKRCDTIFNAISISSVE